MYTYDSEQPNKELILFEFLGDDIEKYVFAKGKRLTRHEMIKLLKELCDALNYSHGRNVIHRGNVTLVRRFFFSFKDDARLTFLFVCAISLLRIVACC